MLKSMHVHCDVHTDAVKETILFRNVSQIVTFFQILISITETISPQIFLETQTIQPFPLNPVKSTTSIC